MNVSGQVCLRRGEESRVRGGAPWIFENELDWADDTCEKGGLVDVLDSRLRFAARGFWNPDSKICVRVLTRDADETMIGNFSAAASCAHGNTAGASALRIPAASYSENRTACPA